MATLNKTPQPHDIRKGLIFPMQETTKTLRCLEQIRQHLFVTRHTVPLDVENIVNASRKPAIVIRYTGKRQCTVQDTYGHPQQDPESYENIKTYKYHRHTQLPTLVPNIDNPTHATRFNIESSHKLGFLHTHREPPRVPTKEIPKEREV